MLHEDYAEEHHQYEEYLDAKEYDDVAKWEYSGDEE